MSVTDSKLEDLKLIRQKLVQEIDSELGWLVEFLENLGENDEEVQEIAAKAREFYSAAFECGEFVEILSDLARIIKER